jgi:hypothetical protein
MRPFSTVETEAFRKLLQVLEPRYVVPGRTHFSEKIIPELYEEVREQVSAEIQTADAVAIITDGWTSRATESYITVTGHFIDEDWNLKNYVLQTRPTDIAHTAINIGEVLKDAVEEWDLRRPHNILPVVTDNASNMDGAIREANLTPHVKCLAHTVNLATQRGLSSTPSC